MKAIIISSYGGPEVLTVTELPDPVPAADEVLIAVRAFGLNHAEAYMRSGAMGEVAQVTGIECAGTVVADPSGRLAEGTAVVAILGGMGRTRNGSYAELVTVPASNVVQVSTSLPWTDLVALPEVYATAWAGLRQNLDLRPGQTVLIRGATSALGQAAVNVAAEQGATVIATTRRPDRAALLERIGAKTVLIDDGQLADQQPARSTASSTWSGTACCATRYASCARAAGCASSAFSAGSSRWRTSTRSPTCPAACSSASTAARSCWARSEFPLTEIPLTEMIGKAENGLYQAKPARVFGFDDVVEAHRVMESGLAGDGRLADQQSGVVDCVFDLVGNRVLRDSLRVVRPRGRVCQLGFLGGLEPVAGFNPIADLPSGVQLSFYGSAFVLGNKRVPAHRDPAHRDNRQGRKWPLPGQAREGIRLR